jgi:hypothetical protein
MTMLYTCSTAAATKKGKMKKYCVTPGHGNDAVAPDKCDVDLYRQGVLTARGFALNYELKLRSSQAYEWMARVAAEASREDVVLIGEEQAAEKTCRTILAEIMANMFSGKISFRYMGELE